MATLFVWHITQKHNHKPLSSHTTMSKHTRVPHTHTSTYLSRHLTKVVDEGNGGLLLNRIFNLVNVLAQVKETTQCGWPIPIPYHSVWVAHSHTTPLSVGGPFPYHTTPCGVVHSHTTFYFITQRCTHIVYTCTETTQAMDSTEHCFNLPTS